MHDPAPTPFHCITPSLSKLEEEIIHLCHFGQVVVLVSGPAGSGRTHCASRLRALIGRSLPAAYVEAHPLLSAEQFDSDALTQLGLHQLANGDWDLNNAVARAPAGRRVLLVDNAQDLSPEILKHLLLTAAAEKDREDPRLLVVLFGDDVMQAALYEIGFGGLADEDFHRTSIPALTDDDARRMAILWAAAYGFVEPNERAVHSCWQVTGGRPGPFLESLMSVQDELQQMPAHEQMEAEMSQAEPVASIRTEKRAPEPAPRGFHLGWLKTPLMVLGGVLVGFMLMYQKEINEMLVGNPHPAVITSKSAEPAASTTRTELDLKAEDAGNNGASVDKSSEPATIELVPEPKELASSTTKPIVPAAEPHPLPTPAKVTNTAEDKTVKAVTPAVTAKPGPVTPASVLSPTVSSKPAVAMAEHKTESKAEAKPVTTAASTKETAKASAPVKTEAYDSGEFHSGILTADENALMQMSASHFAVQVVGLSDEPSMADYIRQYGLTKVKYYRALHGGKIWYVLVLVEFADHAAAEQGRDALPEGIQKQGPWIKSLKAVQQEIRSAVKLP